MILLCSTSPKCHCQRGLINAKWPCFVLKIRLFSKQVCYKVSLYENYITMVEDVPFYLKFWAKVTQPLLLTRTSQPWNLQFKSGTYHHHHFITLRLRSIRTVLLSTSVRLSVKRMDCDKTNAPSEKSSIKTNRKSPTSFPMSLRWASYVAPKPQRGPQKRIFSIFRIKWPFSKKVCYKVSLCENFQRQSCKAFTGLSIRAQTVGGERPLRPEILGQSDPPVSKMAISNRHSPVATVL